MRNIFLAFTLFIFTQVAFGQAGPGAIFQGPNILQLKPNIKFKDSNVLILTNDTDSPAVVAKDAPQGSLYIRSGTGVLYQKLDNGLSTNWQPLLVGPAGSGTDNCVARWDGTGSPTLQDSLFCITDLGVGSGLTQLNVEDLTLDQNTISTTAGNLNLTAFTSLIDFQSNQTTGVRSITPPNPGVPTGVQEHNLQVNIAPSANAPDLQETIMNLRGDYGGGNNLGGLTIFQPNGNTSGAGTLAYISYVYAGGSLGDGVSGGTTSSASMYAGNMGAQAGHTVPQMKGIDISLYDMATSVVTSVTGSNIGMNMDGPSNDINMYNAGFNGGVAANLNTFAGSNINATFQAPVAGTIAGFNFNPTVSATATANAINAFYTNPAVNGLVDSMYGMFIGGNGTSTVTNYTGVDVNPTFTLPSQYLTGYRVSFASDATADTKGTDVQLSGDANTITGHNVNMAGTAATSSVGLAITNNSVVTGGRNVSIGANGQSASINSGADLVNNGNFDAINQVVALGTVQSGTPVSTDFFGLSSPLVLTANDDVTPGALGVGVSAVGYVSQAIVAAGKNVSDMAMATAATIDGGSGAGSSITDWAAFRSLGILNTGGSLAATNVYHFKAETGTVGTNKWGIWVDDSTANNYFSKSVSIGAQTTSNSDIALEIGSLKAIKLPLLTTVQKNALTPLESMFLYDDTLNVPAYYNGTSWVSVGTASSLTLTANTGLRTDATGLVESVVQTDGQILIGSTGVKPQAASITGTANQISVTPGAGSITLSTPQNIAVASSPEFAGLTLTGFSGVVKATAGVLSASAVNLATEVTGILPLANGGSNKNMTASNGSLVYSDADSFEFSGVCTSGQVWISGGAGAPTCYAPTATRVLYAGTGGILADDAGMTYAAANDELTVGSLIANSTTRPSLPCNAVTSAQKTTMAGTLGSGDKGKCVYDTDLLNKYTWNGSSWVADGAGTAGAVFAGSWTNNTNCDIAMGTTTNANFVNVSDADCSVVSEQIDQLTCTMKTDGTIGVTCDALDEGTYEACWETNFNLDAAGTWAMLLRTAWCNGSSACAVTGDDYSGNMQISYNQPVLKEYYSCSTASVTKSGQVTFNLQKQIVATGGGVSTNQLKNNSTGQSIRVTVKRKESGAGGGVHPVIYLSDVKTSGTDGGSSSAGTTYDRNLNTLSDPLTGSFVSNSASFTGTSGTNTDFTLIAGTYRIIAQAPACKPNGTRIRLYNSTDATNDIMGGSLYSNTGTGCLLATLDGIITITSSKTFRIKQYIAATEGGDGLGGSSGDGSPEVYTRVSIEKLR